MSIDKISPHTRNEKSPLLVLFYPQPQIPVKTSNFNCVQLSPKFNHSDKMDSKPFVHHLCIQAKRLRWPLLALQASSEWEVLVRNWERGWINKRNFVLLYSYSCSMPNDKRTSAAPPVTLRCAASSWRKVDQSLDHKRIPCVAQCVHRMPEGGCAEANTTQEGGHTQLLAASSFRWLIGFIVESHWRSLLAGTAPFVFRQLLGWKNEPDIIICC